MVAPVGLIPTHGQFEVLFALVHLRDGQSADGGLDDSRHVACVEAVASSRGTRRCDANGGLAKRAEDAKVRHTRDVLHGSDDLVGLGLIHSQIRPHHLDRVLALDARHGFFHVVGNDLREIEDHAGESAGQVALHVLGERRLGDALAPFGAGTKGRENFDVVEAGHIGTVVGPPQLRDDALDFGPASLLEGTVAGVFAGTTEHDGANVADVAGRLLQGD